MLFFIEALSQGLDDVTATASLSTSNLLIPPPDDITNVLLLPLPYARPPRAVVALWIIWTILSVPSDWVIEISDMRRISSGFSSNDRVMIPSFNVVLNQG